MQLPAQSDRHVPQPDEPKPFPIFILGFHRSGTTLLQSLLDGHHEVVADAGESRFFNQFVPAAARATPAGRAAVANRILLRHFNSPEANNYRFVGHLDAEAIFARFEERLRGSDGRLRNYLPAAILAYGDVTGQVSARTRAWAEKTPHHERYVDHIVRAWPGARLVHVVRDPRSSFAALKRRRPEEMTVDSVAHYWGLSADIALAGRAGRWGPHYLVVRYEDLVSDAQAQMERVARFLELTWSDRLMQPTKAGGTIAWGGNSAFGDRFEAIDQRSLTRWSSELTAEEVRFMESLNARRMAAMGYELTGDSVGPLAALRPRLKNLARSARDRSRRVRTDRLLRDL